MSKVKNLNIVYDKKVELMFALHEVFLYHHPEYKEELDFIECPPILYFKELVDLIPINHYEVICHYLKNGVEELGDIPKLAMCLTDNYEINQNRIEEIKFNYGSLEDFVENFKALALEIQWDAFFKKHELYYEIY